MSSEVVDKVPLYMIGPKISEVISSRGKKVTEIHARRTGANLYSIEVVEAGGDE